MNRLHWSDFHVFDIVWFVLSRRFQWHTLQNVIRRYSPHQKIAKVKNYYFSLAKVPISYFKPVKIAFFWTHWLCDWFWPTFCSNFRKLFVRVDWLEKMTLMDNFPLMNIKKWNDLKDVLVTRFLNLLDLLVLTNRLVR